MSATMFQDYLDSPLGIVTVNSRDGVSICDISFAPPQQLPSCSVTKAAKQQLVEYFSGQRHHFDLPLNAQGTAFQQRVWQQLQTVDYGNTASYADIARAIDNPKGVRAVGMANSRNPIAIVVPCHRVIGANGTLTGYAGGLDKKEWLLRHEGVLGN